MRVLVCGSRTYEDAHRVLQSLVVGLGCVGDNYDDDFTLIEGEATGADALAAQAFEEYDNTPYWRGYFNEEIETTLLRFPADWEKHGRAAGPIRNKQMLDEGKPELVVAFVDKPLEDSRGTANMVKQATAAGIPTYVITRV